MNRPQIISDKNKKSLKIKDLLNKKINNYQFRKNNLIIVIGGDGFMLNSLKRKKIQKNSFMELIQAIMDS